MSSSNRSTQTGHFTHSLKHSAWRISVLILTAFAFSFGVVTVVSAARLYAPMIAATKTDAFIGGDGDGKADPGETIQYTVVVNNSGAGATDATGVGYDDTIDSKTTLVGGSLAASPVGSDDTFPVTVLGNVSIDSAALAVPFSVTTNDYLGLNPIATISAVQAATTVVSNTISATSLQGGQVVMTVSGANIGKFTYNPPSGYEGTDTFTYTLTDNANATSAASNRQATVSITVSGMIWFVDRDNPSTCIAVGCGRLSNPFTTLAAFNGLNDGAGNHPANNDHIFIYESSSPYTGGIALRSGQKLIGQDATQTLSAITGLTSPTGSPALPAMNTGAPATVIQHSSDAVSVQTDVIPALIRGLSLDASAGNNAIDITVSNATSGTLEISENIIVGAGAEGIDINRSGNGTLTLDVHNNTWNSAGTHGNAANEHGFDARTTTPGVINLNFHDNNVMVSNASSSAVSVDGSSGTLTITGFANNSVHQNTAGTGITVNTATFDATSGGTFQQVSGGTTTIGTSGNGVGVSGMVLTNVSGDLDFTDLDIFNDGGTGLSADGTGAIIAASSGFRLTSAGNVASVDSTGGPAVNILDTTINLLFTSIESTNSSTSGVTLDNIDDGTSPSVPSVFSAGSGSSITNAGTTDFVITNNNADVTYAGTITDDVGQLVSATGNNGGTKSFTGAITDGNDGDGSGISLTGNSGGTIRFSGGLLLSTGGNAAFTSTGNTGTTLEVCDENPCNAGATGALVNTITTAAGTALNVANTTIGASNLEFRSISAGTSGTPASGIVLDTTGSNGGLVVKGDSGSTNNGSGGLIQNTTSHGVSLTNTQDVSLDQLNIQTTGGSGINGTQVTDFSYTNGTITGAGNANAESAIAFDGNPSGTSGSGNNINGVLTITGSTFTNAFYSGLDIQSDAGTVSNATLSNNTITNPSFSGLNLVGTGTATTSFTLNNATINQNNISGSGGNGIQVSVSNANASGPGAVAGIPGDGTKIISITNNSVSTDAGGTQAITVANSGANSGNRTKTNFIIQCNGKNTGGCSAPTANPITGSSIGTVVLIGNNGYSDMTGLINNNIIDANHTPGGGGGNGIGGGNGVAGAGTAWTPNLTLVVTNNVITDTDGNGVLLVDRATNGTAALKIANNNVAMPVNAGGSARQGIRVDAGNGTAGEIVNLCLNITGNTSAGSNGASGLGIRKESASTFGIVGLSPSPATGPQAVTFVNGNNPAGGGTDNISTTGGDGTNYTVCSNPAIAMLENSTRLAAQNQKVTTAKVVVQASSITLNATHVFTSSTVAKLSKQARWAKASNVVLLGNTPINSTAQLISAKLPAPAESGENVNVTVGNLPATKSVKIVFRVTVNSSLPQNATKITNQGTVNFDTGQSALTSNGGTIDCEVGSETCTPIDLIDLSVLKSNDTSNTVVLGNSFTWQVQVSNIAISRSAIFTSGQVVLEDHLPSSATYAAPGVTPTGGVIGIPDCSITSNVLTCTAPVGGLTIPSGEAFAVAFNTTPTVPGSLVNPTGGVCKVDPNVVFAENSTANNTCSNTVTVTRPETTVVSLTRTDSNPNNTSSVGWQIVFANPVSGVTASNFSVIQGGSVTGANITGVGTAIQASEPDTTWNITVDTGTGDGTLGLNFVNDTGMNYAVTNTTFTGEVYTIDKTAPTVTSFTRHTPSTNPTNADTLVFEVTFSEAITGFGTADFMVHTNAVPPTTSATPTSVSSGPFRVTISGGDLASFNGVVGLDFSPGMVITDQAGNALANIEPGIDETYTVDNTAPTVTNVTSTAANGAYTTGAVIPVTITFSEAVTVAGGTPQLTLETGATDAVVDYTSGSSSNTLTFNYTVSAGETSADLDYIGTSALALNGSTIRDAVTNNADLTLAAPGAAGSLGNNKNIVIDTTAPTVTNVTSTAANGSYGVGAVIPVTVTFSEAVTVAGGTPQLTLETGATDAVVNYTSGSGTSTLTFNYTVSAGDISADLDYISVSALALNGSTIQDAATNNAVLTLAAPGAAGSLGNNKNIVIDTTAPTVTNVTSAVANATYGLGEVIPITVQFSEPVTVTGGTPQLTLAMTGTPTTEVVDYTSGSGTNTLTFTYTVQLGDLSPDLDYVNTTSLGLNGASITDAATNNAVLTLAAPGAAGSLGFNKNIVIDATNPVVTNVTSTKPDGSYKAGTVIDVTVTFSSLVNVNTAGGTPTLTLETGSTDAVVDYFSGTGSNTLTFRYTVGSTDNSLDLDYVSASSLALNGGTIKDGASNDAILTLASPGASGSLGFNKDIVIDTIQPISINISSTAANGAYTTGAVIPITVQFSESVIVTGTPQLTLETGTTDQVVNYTSGSGTDTLTFNYTVSAGDTSADLDYKNTSALALNGGTIEDAATNTAIIFPLPSPGATFSLGANKNIVIDTTAPTVTNVTSTAANGAYTTGAVIPVTITFSEAVTVAGGTPQLTLETGATDAIVNYSSGSGTSTLTFNYTVSAGDTSADLDYIGTSALALNGSTIQDTATNNAVLTLAAPGAAGSLGNNKNIVIDTTAPTVTNVTSTSANGTYGVGAVIPVTVQFSEPVTVAGGTPQLTLETGATDEVVDYTSGSGTNTLTFTYTVQLGDVSPDLDYVGTTSLALNGATIRDVATNAADLTLAAPGAAGSLGNNKAIVIDGVAPTVTNVTSTTADGNYGIGVLIPVTVTFSEAVTVAGGPPQLTLETGTTDAIVNYVSGSGTATLTFNYTVAAGDVSADLDYVATTSLALNGGTIRDTTLNNAILTLASPGAAGSLGFNKAIVIDGVRPTVSMSSVAVNPTNTSPIPVTVQFSETVTGFIASDITPVVNGTVTNFLPVDGDTYTFDLVPTADGLVSADIGANKAFDIANNGNTAATQFSRTFDSTGPTATLSSATISPTNTSPIPVTITFNEPVTGVGAGDLSATNATTSIPTGGPTVYTFNLTPIADGLVTVKYLAGSASDAATNPNPSDSNILSITYDTTAPTVTVEQAAGQADPTSLSPINFTATFSEPIKGFINADVALSGSAGATTAVVSEIAPMNRTKYNIAVSGMSAAGTVMASIPLNKVSDDANNGNVASTSTDATVTYMNPVSVTINQAAGQADPTTVSPIHFTAVFSEAVSGFTGTDVSFAGTTLTGTLSATITQIAPMNGTTYDVAVKGMIPKGTVFVSIPAGNVASVAHPGVTNKVSTSTDNNVIFDYVLVEFLSVAAKDGWLLEATETSGVGGSMNNGATTLSVGDDASDRQYRSVVNFLTASIPDNAVIYSVNLRMIEAGVTGSNPFATHGALKSEIKSDFFGTSGLLETLDFQSAPNALACNFETVPEILSIGTAYRCVVLSAAFPHINLTSSTQFRLRFTLDDNDDLSADIFDFYSGNHPTSSQTPRLFIKYYLPPTP